MDKYLTMGGYKLNQQQLEQFKEWISTIDSAAFFIERRDDLQLYFMGKLMIEYMETHIDEMDEDKIDNIDNNSICIHNRSWYGEYVYGCMYRYNSPEEVIKMVDILEQGLCKVVNQEDICFITLLSNNIDFLVKNDDGLSISEAKKELIDEEVHRFEKIAEYSHLYNKHVIYVNDGDKFRPKEDIMNEIKRYIGI